METAPWELLLYFDRNLQHQTLQELKDAYGISHENDKLKT